MLATVDKDRSYSIAATAAVVAAAVAALKLLAPQPCRCCPL
jgi:hypothetical protein